MTHVHTYQYWTTDLRTGEVLADWVPLEVGSFSRTLGGVGELSATLNLHTTPSHNAAYLAALEPRRSVLWAAQDGFPVWAGIIWDWPHTSALDYTLPIRAATLESLFDRREIRADATFTGADVFDIVRSLIGTATTGTGKEVANLLLPDTLAGVARTATYPAADGKKILKAIQDLAADSDFEWTVEPGLAGTDGAFHLRLGYPRVGQGAGADWLVLQMPGNVVDYAWPRTGSASANSVASSATASATDGTQGVWRSTAVDQEDIDLGFPVFEDTASYTGTMIGGQAQLDTYTATLLGQRRHATTVPTVKIGGLSAPLLRELTLGSHTWLLVSSPLHPADASTGAPGLQKLVRIIGWTASPPTESQQESVSLHLGEVGE